MKLKSLLIGLSIGFTVLTLSCTHGNLGVVSPTTEFRNPAAKNELSPLSAQNLPAPIPHKTYEVDPDDIKKFKIPEPLVKALNNYFTFLGINPRESGARKARSSDPEDEDVQGGRETLLRLLNSSTQFLLCKSFEDWECLESPPSLAPTSTFRKDAKEGLGKKIVAGNSLKMQYFFTKQYLLEFAKRNPNEFLALQLAAIMKQDWNSISMALYGMDDISGSMKPIYDAIVAAKEKQTEIRAIFDIEGVEKVNHSPIYFTHRGDVKSFAKSKEVNEERQNIFTVIQRDSAGRLFRTERTIGQFQYKETPNLVELLNTGVESDAQTKARIEWPPSNEIMHNKFIVFSNQLTNKAAVWTGTANVAKTCMGIEDNSNMSVYIEDSNIANAFQEEFEEMFQFAGHNKSAKFSGYDKPEIPMGKFHKNKTPNTHRYFYYRDGTEVRVHFSPTDDGEHRAILPALLSARQGDEIRISMFFSGGLEFIRAIQYAVEKGAVVRIVFDKFSNGPSSWIKNPIANIQKLNVYSDQPRGSLEYRMNDWGGLNHHKTATITRMLPNGEKRAEVLIVGSQNWTLPGNDSSDENMLTIRNIEKGVEAAAAFNEHFDKLLWSGSIPYVPRVKSENDHK